MKNTVGRGLIMRMKEAQAKLLQLSSKEKSALERSWDIEHAYYSSVLEGSKLDRKEFEKLAEQVS